MPRVETDNYWMPPEGWAGHAAPTPKPVPSRDRRRVSEGKTVELHSLKARPELNGCIAEVVGPLAQGGRVPVRILLPAQFAGQGVKLKPANVRAEGTGGASRERSKGKGKKGRGARS